MFYYRTIQGTPPEFRHQIKRAERKKMDNSVNFKIRYSSKEEICQAFSLSVTVEKLFSIDTDYSYFVRASVYETPVPITIGYCFTTPDEAFEYMERIEKLYPPFGDERDWFIENSPEFDINLIKEPGPSSATK